MERTKRVLISGAGIAGPALAYWLGRYGMHATVVERAPGLRLGGQAVDFRGPVHRAVLEKMGIWQAIHERQTAPGKMVLLNQAGAPHATLPEVIATEDVEILREDLIDILYQRTRHASTYRFGDRITRIEERDGGVHVRFERGEPEVFDLVVGADGLHSDMRALAFGEEQRWLRHHGYRMATFSVPRLTEGSDMQIFSVPGGRSAALATGAGGGSRAILIHLGAPVAARPDLAAERVGLRKTYAGMTWHVPAILDALDVADDLYLDSISTVHVDSYARGRVALLGDAAYGGTLGGQGTSLGIVGAYVLASEIATAPDHRVAFQRYEALMRPYATGCQKGAMRAGMFFAPRTAWGLWIRNAAHWVLAKPRFVKWFERMAKADAESFVLPEYSPSAATAGRLGAPSMSSVDL